MILADLLRLVLHGGAPDQRVLHLLDDGTVDLVTEVLDGAPGRLEDNRGFVVGQLALRLGVNPDQHQILPKLLQEGVIVPLVMGRDGDAVRDVANDVQLLETKKN